MNEKKARWYGPKQISMMIYTAVVMLVAASVVGGNNNTVFPVLAQARGWDIAVINVVSGIAAMIVGVGVFVFARPVKKFGPKKVIVVTMLLSAVLLVIFGTTKSLPVFLLVILALGFLSAAYEKCGSMVLTANWWPSKKGIVLGFTTMGVVAMNVVYVPMMPKLFQAVGIPAGMGIIAAIVAVVGLWVLCLKNTPEEAGTYPDGDPVYATEDGKAFGEKMKEYVSPFTFKKVCADRNTWLIGGGAALSYMACMSFIASTIPTLIGFGYSPAFGTTVFAVGGVVSFVGSFLFGAIDQKVGTKNAYKIYFICLIIAFVFALMMAKQAAFVWLASIILFCAQGAGCNLLPSYVATKYGRWDYAAGYQVIGTLFAFGGGAGIMITGFFKNPYMMYGFDIAVLAIGLIMMWCSNSKMIGKAD